MKKVNKFTYILATIFAAVVFIFFSIFAGVGVVVYADTPASARVAAYEQRNVLDDLMESTIDGEPFDLFNYGFDSRKQTQVLNFVEYCYSFYANKQSDYGLYLYVYNPQGYVFDTDTDRNKIQFAFGDSLNWSKYSLKMLNYSTSPGYEGLFYKFKVDLTNSECESILNGVIQNSRMYKLSGIELSVDSVVTEYAIASTYTYSGFALGYGSSLMTESTLSCTVDGVENYLSLDVHSTYYRPGGTNGNDYARDTLHSVYFAVPNEIIEEYGEMSAVHATWLNAFTAPIFVTGNTDIYNAVYEYLGDYVYGGDYKYIKSPNHNTELQYSLIASNLIQSAGWNHASHSFSYMSYNENRYYTSSNVSLEYLYYCFLADDNNADSYVLPSTSLLGDKENGIDGWFKTFTDWYLQNGHSVKPDDSDTLVSGADPGVKDLLVNDKYLSYLFDYVADDFTDITITKDDTFKLTDEDISQNWWQRVVGGGYQVNATNEYTISAIKKVESSDIKSTAAETCLGLYIAESDYNDFYSFYRKSQKNNETVYLFRYYQSEYTHYEVAEYARGKGDYEILGQSNLFDYDYVDTNAYFMQMWVQLDFDIIDLTFTKDGVDMVIPVVMSPMDIAADGDTTLFASDGELPWWVKLVALAFLLIIIMIIGIYFPPLFTFIGKLLTAILNGLIWLITAPFKTIDRAVKKRKK